MDINATNKALLDALGRVVDLPPGLVSLRLMIGVDRIPLLDLVQHVDIDVDAIATEQAEPEPVLRRYKLVEG